MNADERGFFTDLSNFIRFIRVYPRKSAADFL